MCIRDRPSFVVIVLISLSPFFTVSGSVLYYPCDILIHPVLQEFLAACTDVAGPVKQPLLYINECFGLSQRRYVQIRENVAQMLLCHSRAGGTDRSAQHTGGLARPNAL